MRPKLHFCCIWGGGECSSSACQFKFLCNITDMQLRLSARECILPSYSGQESTSDPLPVSEGLGAGLSIPTTRNQ